MAISNDMVLIASFLTFFTILGILLPVINSGFDTEYTGIGGIGDLEEDVGNESDNNQLSIWRVIFSMISVFFWSFGELPVLLNTFLLIPRIIFILTVVRNIWIGGGS